MQMRLVFTCALLGVSLAGCYRLRAPADVGGRYLITQEELERYKDRTLYDAVSKLRPHFLKNRSVTAYGKGATHQMQLYVNGEKMDGIDDMRRLWPSDVAEVRFYEPQLANAYFARYNNAGGAIAVKLRWTSEITSVKPQN